MRTSITLGLFLFGVLQAGAAAADPFVFHTALTTGGVFTCLGSVACEGSGTSEVTLSSGANTATLRFTGVDTILAIDNRARPVALGSIEASASSGFTFPTRRNPNVPVLRFDFSLAHSSPAAGTRTILWFFGPGGDTVLPLMMGPFYKAFSTGSTSPGARYPFFVYRFESSPAGFRIPSNGRLDIGADVGAVPEPATLLLVGAGLAGACARRRRRSSGAVTSART